MQRKILPQNLKKLKKVEKKIGRHFRAQGTLNRGGSGIPCRRRRQPSRRGCQPTIVSKISKKLHEIAKILGRAATAEVPSVNFMNSERGGEGGEGGHMHSKILVCIGSDTARISQGTEKLQ